MLLSLLAMLSVMSISAKSVYDFKVKDMGGQEVALAGYKGKVMLIVNTATR